MEKGSFCLCQLSLLVTQLLISRIDPKKYSTNMLAPCNIQRDNKISLCRSILCVRVATHFATINLVHRRKVKS